MKSFMCSDTEIIGNQTRCNIKILSTHFSTIAFGVVIWVEKIQQTSAQFLKHTFTILKRIMGLRENLGKNQISKKFPLHLSKASLSYCCQIWWKKNSTNHFAPPQCQAMPMFWECDVWHGGWSTTRCVNWTVKNKPGQKS